MIKKIISSISALAVVASVFASFATVANAASNGAYVKLINQTDTHFTLEIGTTQDANYAMFESFEFALNIPESILNAGVASYADRLTTDLMYHKKTSFATSPTVFNSNLFKPQYSTEGISPSVAANYSNGQLKYAVAIARPGAEVTANGAFVQITLPLAAPIANDTELTLDYMVVSETQDGETYYNAVKDNAEGKYAGITNVVLPVSGSCVLEGAAAPEPVLTATPNAVESIVAPSGKTTYAVSGNVTVENGATFNKVTLFINDETDADNVLSAKKEWTFDTAISANAFFGLNIWGAPAKRTITVDIVAE